MSNARKWRDLFGQFLRNPIESFKNWPRLQAWALFVTAALLALDLVAAFFMPKEWAWSTVAIVFFLLFCLIMYAHIRTIYTQRDRARDEQVTSLEVLGFVKKDLNQLCRRLTKSRNSTDVTPEQREREGRTIWTRAGEDLRIAIAHGLFREGKYAALWSCIKVAESSPTTGVTTPLGAAVFYVAVSLWEQEQDVEGMNQSQDKRLEFGMKRFEKEIDDRVRRLAEKLGD